MRTCGHCGDRYDSDTRHECWVVAKVAAQESLAAPEWSDYAATRPVLSDVAWFALHG